MKFLSATFLILITISVFSQKVRLKKIAKLPKNIPESSGICVNPDGTLWTHNDSDEQARIYKIDTLGNLLKTLYLKGATLFDYEDMNRDKHGNIYVCDCGNNFNNRKNLCIYKISFEDLQLGKDTVTPQVIRFSYPDQKLFPPKKRNKNFDCEAMVTYNDTIYLFSKNRGKSRYCKRYALPAKEGTYTALLIDSVKTKRWITSAALSPNAKTLVLLSENKLTVFTGIAGSNFFIPKPRYLRLPITLKEGLAFKNDSAVYIVDENLKLFGGKLYGVSLQKILKQ